MHLGDFLSPIVVKAQGWQNSSISVTITESHGNSAILGVPPLRKRATAYRQNGRFAGHLTLAAIELWH